MTETAAATADQAREGCPAWCAQDEKHMMTDYGELHHRSENREFMTPDFWTIRVYLYQIGDDKPLMRVGLLGLLQDDAYPCTQREDLADLLRKLGHEDIAAAVEELAALAGQP